MHASEYTRSGPARRGHFRGTRAIETMRRRKFLIGAGSFAAGTAGVLGTGAVDRLTAGRNVTVKTVGDGSAEVKLLASSSYASYNSNGELVLNLSQLNPDADLEFFDLFTIRNTANQALGIFVDNAGPGASADREQPPENANMYQKVKNAFGTPSHGWFDEDRNAGKINLGAAMPSAYRNSATNSAGKKPWSPASDPYILQSGNEMTPDWYIFDTPSKGNSVTGVLDVWAFSKEYAQAGKGP